MPDDIFSAPPLLALDLPGVPKIASGKVREVFAVGADQLLLVATDRLSAFDVVFAEPIPGKGAVLTQLSAFWFRQLAGIMPNHLITADADEFPDLLQPYREVLRGRSMLVRRTVPVRAECIARGYLAGSGWKEYQESGHVGGYPLPAGLRQADRLPEPLFTPSTKPEAGKDENLTWDQFEKLLGPETARLLRQHTLQLWQAGHDYARERGIIIADTKFEFGWDDAGQLMLIDEALTPDSSRFWPETDYRPGGSPPSFDKQFVRDFLEASGWDKQPPAPKLPEEIITKTAEKYRDALERLAA
jgi:phosphoribosylaminoimidazole-succinocarboxamide synthase